MDITNHDLPDSILVVEEDDDDRDYLCQLLEDDGYLTTVACNTDGAARSLACGEFAAIILNLHAFGDTEDQTLSKFAELAPDVPRIIITGMADMNGIIAALRHGAADYIIKPVNPECLRASLIRVSHLLEAQQRAAQSERLAAIGQTVASVAHESRNLLQRIQTRVDMMRIVHQRDDGLLKGLSGIQAASDQLQFIFEELREYSAPITLDRQRLAIKPLIERAWENAMKLPRSKDVTLSIHMQDQECFVDPLRIEQVFRNLFENALAASPESARIEVTASMVRHGEQIATRIAVRDNGPGFTDQQRERAFDPFFTTKKTGSGLGLAISKRIVELHQGRLAIATGPSDGATLLVTLPNATGGNDYESPCESVRVPSRSVRKLRTRRSGEFSQPTTEAHD